MWLVRVCMCVCVLECVSFNVSLHRRRVLIVHKSILSLTL